MVAKQIAAGAPAAKLALVDHTGLSPKKEPMFGMEASTKNTSMGKASIWKRTANKQNGKPTQVEAADSLGPAVKGTRLLSAPLLKV